MQSTSHKNAFQSGLRNGAPFLLVVGPFALLFGVVSLEAGLSLFETMMFSTVVIAGAAQFTALQLLVEDAPTLIVIASALAVNLRMAMYSASLTPHFGGLPLWQRAVAAYLTVDQSYAVSIAEYERRPDMRPSEKFAFFLGAATAVVPIWFVMSMVGAIMGTAIPEGAALDFAIPITFIAIVAPMCTTLAHLAAVFVAVAASLALVWVPFNLGLLISALLAMMTGAQVELWTKGPRT